VALNSVLCADSAIKNPLTHSLSQAVVANAFFMNLESMERVWWLQMSSCFC